MQRTFFSEQKNEKTQDLRHLSLRNSKNSQSELKLNCNRVPFLPFLLIEFPDHFLTMSKILFHLDYKRVHQPK